MLDWTFMVIGLALQLIVLIKYVKGDFERFTGPWIPFGISLFGIMGVSILFQAVT